MNKHFYDGPKLKIGKDFIKIKQRNILLDYAEIKSISVKNTRLNKAWLLYLLSILFKKVFVIFLFLLPFAADSVTNFKIDSLNQKLKRSLQPQDKLQILLELSRDQIETGNKEAIYTTEAAYKLADSLHLEIEKAKSLNLQGIAWKIWGDNQKSVLYLFEALGIYKKSDRQSDYAEVLMNIGETNRAAGNLQKSMDYLNTSLNIYKKANNSMGLARIYNRLAATSYEIYLNDTTLNHKLVKFDFKKVHNSDSAFRREYDLILGYANLSNVYADKQNLATVKISTQIIIGALYSITYQFQKALPVLNNVLEDIRNTNSTTELPLALYDFAILHYKMKDYDNALKSAMESYRIAKQLDIKTYILLSAGLICEIYLAEDKYKEANEYMRIAYLGRMDYYQKDINVKLKAVQYDFDIATKKKEISNRKAELLVLFLSFVIILIITFIFIILLARRNKKTKLLNQELKEKNRIILQLNESLEERVTERTIQLETLNQELEFHLKEIEQFTYIATHDLQEPLQTLTNFTQLFKEEYTGKLDEDGNKYVAFIYNSAERMRALVKDLLEYSLLGKGSDISMVDCNKIVGEVLSDLSDTILRSNAGITVRELPTINGHATELRLLFQNLVNNAIKFQKKGVRPEIKISAETQEKEWIFAVEDNGIGVQEKDKEKIFVIFRQMHNRNEYEGTGIGLAHCKKIVELHGGKIWVESNPGTGSVFIFTIPKR
ncbi:MAG: ATP-binding protein [Bacteroidetes bacterium]|nr:ATP-binding protein [Bacteroidota bacterium]